jgi:N-acetylmuramic acid 6-phosphate etherase
MAAPAREVRHLSVVMSTESKWQRLPTEAINRRTLDIDTMPIDEIVAVINREDRRTVAAVEKVRPQIAAAVKLIVASLSEGGRVFFVGAGTSGRLGVLEAAEVPPTFGTPPTLVRAVIAGGEPSVFRAREGAEDNYEDGVRQMARVKVARRDVVVGVSASGVTEFVRGALTRARRVRARRVLVTCRPGTDRTLADVTIAPEVGPEVIAGSTRMKAGTATKLVLNMLTTIPMVKLGKTYGNLMVDVRTGSAKLKDRATRMVSMVTGLAPKDAAALLAQAHWNVKTAIVMAKTGSSSARARRRLDEAGGSMRVALGEDLTAVLRRQARRTTS